MNPNQTAEKVIEYVGGKENIISLTHCVTRLRFNLKDDKQVDAEQIKALDDVMGIQNKGGQYQVIIGPKVAQVYRAVVSAIPELEKEPLEKKEEKTKESILNRLINALSAILVPSLAPIIGGGMLKGILYLFTTLKWADPASGTMFVLNVASDAMFYFFPFLLAISAAKFYKTNEYMAATLAGVLLYPTIIAAAGAKQAASVFFLGFLPIPMVNYSQSVIPIILSVWFLSYVYHFFDKRMPSMITVIFTPLLSLLIVVPVMLFGIAPLGFYIGDYVAKGIQVLIDFSPLLAGAIIGGTRPFLVLMGMHHALRPIVIQQISTYGYSEMGAMNFMSTMAQATAAFGIYLIIKNKKMKQISLSSTVSGFLGITEPALYGVLVKYRAAFVGASLGGAIGGAVGASMGAKAMAITMPSILSIPVYLNDATVGFLVGFAVTLISSFILTIFLAKTVFKINEEESGEEGIKKVDAKSRVFHIKSPVTGDVYLTEDVPDETFSKALMGKTVAIMPRSSQIVSPVNGHVQTIFPTGHAIGLVSDEGVEVLIHIGLDTVNLEGKYFESLVANGEPIKQGTPLVNFDRDKIQASGYDPTVLIVVTNSDKYLSLLSPDDSQKIQAGENLIQVVPEREPALIENEFPVKA
ncbi:beta-glucoside-specific PTS transporter subunit IIABC [Listeria kieliensis]|uniref:PTS system, glucose subfamily, IIA component n=1 Tax=Listeria kieliensis TaxID=1621700 RepID=A0A3D8TVB3_9LIST|nr:beta-glucoside-specific PTS transporter subunit IIABC [Listeria kieliensis]RDX02597.1 PTS system, glucose subfamily, IIA component [Listeria kieliensis]